MATVSDSYPLFEPKKSVVIRTEDGREQRYLYLPDTMAEWPWPRKISPYDEDSELKSEATAWIMSLKPFTPESEYAYEKCAVGHLIALTSPDVSREALRIGIDLMSVFLVIDEYTDVETAPAVRDMVEVIVDALRNPEKSRPQGEIMLGEMTRQFWLRARAIATPEAAKHFVEGFTDFLDSLIVQAADRDSNTLRNIDNYFATRRQNVGMRPALFPGELHLSIPDEVFYHPVIKELEYFCADLVILDNDIASYNKEQATGNVRHNILTIFMRQFNVDFDSAMNWVVEYHKQVQLGFLDALRRVPSWGPDIDSQVAVYTELLANWPRGNYCWNYESGRYFGSRGLEYQKTRLVPLLPKRPQNPNLRRENVEVPIVDKIAGQMDMASSLAPAPVAADVAGLGES